ncbi:hypothetical protein NQ318_014445 [Aromia moschata]|uniref:Uncharacterized protein n=1 Tax=Aromia moschata TaxID=1265417 RepID=A0AAV8Y6Y4_9CUCU|nr:hypothetical protein NQ318_014445 [Aromia moschata]
MVYLTEMHKITTLQMIGYGDRTRTQAEVVRLFQEKISGVATDISRSRYHCEQMMQMIDDNTLQIENVLFTIESTFTLHGHVNRQNCRYWSRENPHWMRELHTQNPEKVNVWGGIIGENIIGPFFIDGNLNGKLIIALLQNNVVPTKLVLL